MLVHGRKPWGFILELYRWVENNYVCVKQEVVVGQEEVGAAEVAGVALAVVLGVEEVAEEATEGVSEGAVAVGVSEVVQEVVDVGGAASEGTLLA